MLLHPKEMASVYERDAYTSVFIAALLRITKIRYQLKYPLADQSKGNVVFLNVRILFIH